ncbi:helix-turn-helix domain-containing protein, partial [Klebsiella pneumoniae]
MRVLRMSEVSIADRIKKAIIDNGGYQNISDVTGISKSTLARMAANQTEPKLKDVMAISKATGVSLNYIAYGMLTEDEEESALNEKKMFNLILNLVNHVSREVEELRAKVGVNDPKGNL